jgi:hypothetical protein
MLMRYRFAHRLYVILPAMNFIFTLKFQIVTLLFILSIGSVNSQVIGQPLSPAAQISILTIEPGNELYNAFGHSAIRVSDPATSMDRVYNYGTFDFTQPNFYVNFCRGKLLYMLDVETYRSFDRGNRAEGRSHREQILELTPEQRDRFFDLLKTNALPENRDYKYDFFFDNCATRIRDLMRNAYAEPVQFDDSTVPKDATLRQLLRPYLKQQPWTQFGIDLVLGMPSDQMASSEYAMFLPDYLHNAVAKATVSQGRGVVRAEFCSPIFDNKRQEYSWLSYLTHPFAVSCLVALVGILCLFNQRANRIFDLVFWTVLGLAGVIIALLWFATDHQATKTNLNMFWALPTHLIFGWRTFGKSPLAERYFALTTLLAGLMLAIWAFLPQELPYQALPIVILILIKGIVRWWRYEKTP